MATDEHKTPDEGGIVDKPVNSPVIACGSNANTAATPTRAVSDEPGSPDTASSIKSNLRPEAAEFLPKGRQTRSQKQEAETEAENSFMTAGSASLSVTAAPVSPTNICTTLVLTDTITALEEPKQQQEEVKASHPENSNDDDEIRKMAASHARGSFSTVTNSPTASAAAMVPDMAHHDDDDAVHRSMTPATPPLIPSPHIMARGQEELGHGNFPIGKGEDSNLVEAELEATKLKPFGEPIPVMVTSPNTGAIMYNPNTVPDANYALPDEQYLQDPAPRYGTNTQVVCTNPYPFGGHTLLSSGDDPVSEGRRIYLGNLDYNVSRYEVKMLLRHYGVYRTVEKIYMPFQDPNNEREISSMEVTSMGGTNTLLGTGGGRFPSYGGSFNSGTYLQYPSRRPSPYDDDDGPYADTEGNVAMKNKGFVFVTYSRASEADEALSRLNGAIHCNRRLVCRPGLPKGISFRVGSAGNFPQQQTQQLDGYNGGSIYSSYNNTHNGLDNEDKYYGGNYHGGGSMYSSSAMNGYGSGGNDAGTGGYGPYSRTSYGRSERDEYSSRGGSNGYYSGYAGTANNRRDDHRFGSGGGGGYNGNGDGSSNDAGYGRGRWQQSSSSSSRGFGHGSGGDFGMQGVGGRAGWSQTHQQLGERKHQETLDLPNVSAISGSGSPITYGYTTYKFKALSVKPGGANTGANAGSGGAYAAASGARGGLEAESDATKNNSNSSYYCGTGGVSLAGVRPRSAFDLGYAGDPDDRLKGYVPL